MAADKPRSALVLQPGEGRSYPMGRIAALFKGPGAHSHPDDDVFYVIEGVMSFRVGDEWLDAAKGAFVLVPGGVTHDFENRSAARAGGG